MSIKNNFRKDVLIMEKHFKRTSAVLLIATSFILNLNTINAVASKDPLSKTYSYEVGDFGAKFETFCYEDKKLGKDVLISMRRSTEMNAIIESVIYEGLPFSVQKDLYDKKLHSKHSLKRIYQNAKNKIYEIFGLNYTDNVENEILIDSNPGAEFTSYINTIRINKDELFDNETLAHEMTHALLHSLGGRCNNINLGINEGFASQNQKLDYYGSPFDFPTSKNILFSESYSSNNFYALHQHLIHDWIETEGKNVVKKWVEKVKNGEDSVKAFLDLGGDKIAQKYNYTIGK